MVGGRRNLGARDRNQGRDTELHRAEVGAEGGGEPESKRKFQKNK
jgi:hypothetical protein